ncbi:thiamine pyrophosphokinase, catalytic domain-containing protein [Phthorimaea operculella]|nr:thiamine pyrophosphokinase, catalytic domain-containing protein [Phthorimaea operculella]
MDDGTSYPLPSIWNVPLVLDTEKKPNHKYAVLILNRPLTQNAGFLVDFWNNATVRFTVDGGTREWDNYVNKLSPEVQKTIRRPDFITGDFDSVTEDILQKYQAKGCEVILFSSLLTSSIFFHQIIKFLNQQLNEANEQLADLHQEKEDIENKFSVSLHHELEVQDISTVRHTILTKGNKIKKYLRLNKFIKKTRHNLKLLRLTVKQQPNRIKRINLLKHTDEYKLLIRKMQEEFHQAEIKIKQMTMQITASESLHTSSELYIDHLQTQLANVETKYAESRLAHEQLSLATSSYYNYSNRMQSYWTC